MTESPPVTFSGKQRVLLSNLIEHWQHDASTAAHCATLCADQDDKDKLIRRQQLFERCAVEVSVVLETGRLPPRVAHRVGLEAMQTRVGG